MGSPPPPPMIDYTRVAATLTLSVVLLATACARADPELGPVRRAVVLWALDPARSGTNPAPDVLVIRLGPGEERANVGFPGDTVFLIGPVREGEFWEVRDPALRYLFIKEVSLIGEREIDLKAEFAIVEIEHLFGDEVTSLMIRLVKRAGAWEVIQVARLSAE